MYIVKNKLDHYKSYYSDTIYCVGNKLFTSCHFCIRIKMGYYVINFYFQLLDKHNFKILKYPSGGAMAVDVATFSLLIMTLSYIYVKKLYIDTWHGMWFIFLEKLFKT